MWPTARIEIVYLPRLQPVGREAVASCSLAATVVVMVVPSRLTLTRTPSIWAPGRSDGLSAERILGLSSAGHDRANAPSMTPPMIVHKQNRLVA
jgi:hypothetical protein